MNATYPLSIYYDSSCPLCNQEMIRLKILDQSNNLHLIDCSCSSFSPPVGAPSKEKMMQLLHVQAADGLWVIGVSAFRLVYAGVGFKFVADWLDRPYVKRIMNHAYPLIAKNRYLIPSWFAEVWFNPDFPLGLVARAIKRLKMCEKNQKMCGKRSHSTVTNIFWFFSRRFSLLTDRSRGLMENLGLTGWPNRRNVAANRAPKANAQSEFSPVSLY